MDDFIATIDWEEAFIREMYVQSRSYVIAEPRGVFAAESAAAAIVLITSPNPVCPGVELLFEEVVDVSLPIGVDLMPRGRIDSRHVSFCFNADQSLTGIRAAYLSYRLVDQLYWGPKVSHGARSLFDAHGDLFGSAIDS
jgi:hypothetical protein